jgi:Fe2+ or Zn2+ uptake regulation protein
MNPEELLHSRGIRITRQRISFIEVIDSAGRPLRATELADRLQGEMHKVSVYRVIEDLLQAGLLQSIATGSLFPAFTLERSPERIPAVCRRCGDTGYVISEGTLRAQSSIDFPLIDTLTTCVTGLCKNCV